MASEQPSMRQGSPGYLLDLIITVAVACLSKPGSFDVNQCCCRFRHNVALEFMDRCAVDKLYVRVWSEAISNVIQRMKRSQKLRACF